MTNRLFLGNLRFDVGEDDLCQFVRRNGFQVEDAVIVIDKETRRSKGFGFVSLKPGEEVQKAIEALNNQNLHGRAITVNLAHPKKEG